MRSFSGNRRRCVSQPAAATTIQISVAKNCWPPSFGSSRKPSGGDGQAEPGQHHAGAAERGEPQQCPRPVPVGDETAGDGERDDHDSTEEPAGVVGLQNTTELRSDHRAGDDADEECGELEDQGRGHPHHYRADRRDQERRPERQRQQIGQEPAEAEARGENGDVE